MPASKDFSPYVVNKLNRHTCWVLAFAVLVFASCGAQYRLVKSNRVDYPINQSVPADSNIMRLYAPYKVKMDAEMNKVIAHSALLMSKKSSDTLPESLLSNFFADAVLRQAIKIDPGIDFALPSTKGGLRVDLPKGEITIAHVFELMPFENQLVVITLKGTDLQRLLNFIASTNGQPVAGLRMKIVDKKPAAVFINGKAFDPAKTYKVLTTDYLSSGGDKTLGFESPLDQKVLGLKVRDALMNDVKEIESAGKSLNSKLDGRITKG